MRRVLILASLASLAAASPALAEQRSYPLSGFTSVGVGGADAVKVRVGGGYSVRAEGLPADLADLKIERKGDAIDIRRERGQWQRRGAKPVTVFVTMPRIEGANVGGSGSLDIDRADAKAFEANVGGSGMIAIGQLASNEATFNIGGSGSIRAAGRVNDLSVSIGGSGDVAAPTLTAAKADVTVAGSGSVRARVVGDADVTITGSGDVDLGPDARCDVTKMGSGRVTCRRRG
ncbi:hypothetical protein GGQ80_000580 [Sphingomonas jinjuensis]|uniref:Putative auto-transporter adhesin head GIN domain-containing protein n=1 Tax=Sphingomonas jinjuensis TaxID=535907 RepID=A0A840FA97_9SPHN|nr:head GIN domain-containing protein [Sphingomonas jinjuensis]MBB4152704.1 hypothetical protein [Sphingomonas jinjuensis]